MLLVSAMIAISAYASVTQSQTDVITNITTITTREPGVTNLSDLFRNADIVALVKTTAGDAESYDVAIYKSKVVKSFKGSKEGEDIYFGPYIGERLGWEYVVFLRRENKMLLPNAGAKGGYGPIRYASRFLRKGIAQ